MNAEELQRAASRLRTSLALFEPGVAMQRANLRRRFPEATDEEIASLLRAWLQDRPGAEHGDASGDDFRVRTR